MEFDINDVSRIGSVADVPGYMLPPEAWTLALNMRYSDDGIQALDGWVQTFNVPPPDIEPHFTFPVVTTTGVLWPYVSLTNAAVWNGTTHTDITNGAGYTTSDTYQWNGTMLGEVLIFNNGVNQPQAWLPPYTGDLVNLANFSGFTMANPPSGFTDPITRLAKVIRAFGSFLIAVDITSNDPPSPAGTNHPHRVLWSHPADPGGVPKSWDVSDTTVDAASIDLPDVAAGICMDALPLGSIMYIYKEASIWKMRYVGGQSIFDFGQSSWITTAGLLGQRCVCVTGDGTKHVLATQDDIIWHNGNNVQSILDKRQRRRLQNEIDTTNFYQSFIFANPFNNEVWFCYPSSGNVYPNKALILNYKTAGGNEWVVTEADGITFRNAAVGTIETPSLEQWGGGETVTGNSGTSFLFDIGNAYTEGFAMSFVGDFIPPEIVVGTTYYVRNPNSSGFELSATPGGAVITFTTNVNMRTVWGPTDQWDQFTGPWSVRERRRVILCNPAQSRFYNFGVGTLRDGVPFTSTLQREGLALIGKKRSGEPIVDHRRMKTLMRMWPKIITAAQTNSINIRFGAQQTVDGAIGWGAAKAFNPAMDVYADPGPVTGRAVGVELSQQGVLWRLDGYKLDMNILGEY